MSAGDLKVPGAIRQAASSSAYRLYVLAVLTAVYMFNVIDRNVMILLLQPIKQDLHLSDTQLGFLTGIAFGLFYATLGLPIARWADRGNRVTIASLAIGTWGLTVMSCLFVTNYAQLVLARVAAAVGEAGGKPPTYSLVGDYFPAPAERTRALAIYMAGSPLSSLVSFMAAGWLHDLYGWRVTFLLMGIPGLLLALIVKLTVTEPRESQPTAQVHSAKSPPLRAALVLLWRQRSLRHLNLALILLYTMGLGMAPWYAAFMMRTHAMSTTEVGTWFGLIFGLGGVAGSLLGGYVASRWFSDNERGQMRMNAVAVMGLVPCYLAFLVSPNKWGALAALTLLIISFSLYLGPAYALMQRLVIAEMRATMLALVMLLANLIGFGVGPQLVGIMSDAMAPSVGGDSLRYAMLVMSFVALWAGYHFWKVGDSVKADLIDAHA